MRVTDVCSVSRSRNQRAPSAAATIAKVQCEERSRPREPEPATLSECERRDEQDEHHAGEHQRGAAGRQLPGDALAFALDEIE